MTPFEPSRAGQARPFVVPVHLPGAPNRGSLIDVPERPACTDLAAWVERARAHVESALTARPASRKGPAQIAFFGGSFGALDVATQQGILDGLAEYADSRVDSLRVTLDPLDCDDGMLARLKAAKVATIELDAGSFDDEALSVCGLKHRAAGTVDAATRLKQRGFELGIVLRPGMPGGTPAEIVRSARRVAELAPSFVRIYPVLVLAGTPLALAFESRRYRPLSLEEAIGICKDMLRLFEGAGIAVGRLGFQPAVDLEGGAVVLAGPHHPSLRSLVEASLWFDRAVRLITDHFRFQRELTLVIAACDESRLRGPQGGNVRRLREKFRLGKLVVRADDAAAPGSLALEIVEADGQAVVLRAG